LQFFVAEGKLKPSLRQLREVLFRLQKHFLELGLPFFQELDHVLHKNIPFDDGFHSEAGVPAGSTWHRHQQH
ncbi:MAG: hypothetical protein IKM88_15565, partial [Lachnospiraceae bacterium]|nr:hypothetical protein [Lachnospiraceae bacterium]